MILAFISSQLRSHVSAAEVLLHRSDPEFRESGLRVASLIRLDRLVTLSDAHLLRRIGRLGPQTQLGVDAALRQVLSLSGD